MAERRMGDNLRLSVDDCLRKVEECRKLSVERNLSEVQRTMLEYIAETWERLSKSAWGAR
jgi:hypothetical protein